MILEVAVLDVRAGEGARFEQAFRRAEPLIQSAAGYQRHELRRCVEKAGRYLLLVWWETLENHTEDFRKSDRYALARHAASFLRTVPGRGALFGTSDRDPQFASWPVANSLACHPSESGNRGLLHVLRWIPASPTSAGETI